MGPRARSELVKPIGASRPDRRIDPPRLATIAMVLAVGSVLGWLGASLGLDGRAPSTADQHGVSPTVDRSSLSDDPELDEAIAVVWAEAAVVPDIELGWELAGHSGVVEIGGQVYMIIGLRQPATGDEVAELWSSDDGLRWKSQPLDLGESIETPRLTTTAHRLLLTARSGANDALWQATPAQGNDPLVWSRVPFEIPDGLSDEVLTTAVTHDGNVIAVMIGDMEIWQGVIAPFLPESVNLDDGGFRYEGDEFLYGLGDRADIRLFAEQPEVVIADRRVWVRIVTRAGEEVLRAVPLPADTHPTIDHPRLTEIQLSAAWISHDGDDFVPVRGTDALPDGYFRPWPWGDGFVAAVYQPDDSTGANGGTVLWRSETGRAWEPDPSQPPPECSPFAVVVSGESIHLTSATGTQCRRDLESEWLVLDEPCTVCYKVGGDAGFLGYPKNFEYDRGVLSRDGIVWSEIVVPATEPYPTLSVLADRLLAMSVYDEVRERPGQIRIWLGTIG